MSARTTTTEQIREIARLWREGLTQRQIARRVGVDRGSVAHYAKKFRLVGIEGVLAARRKEEVA